MDNQRAPFDDAHDQQHYVYHSPDGYSHPLEHYSQRQVAGEKLISLPPRRPVKMSTLIKLIPPAVILFLLVFLLLGGGQVVQQVVSAKNTEIQSVVVSHPDRVIIHDESGQVHIHSGSAGVVTVTSTKYFSGWDPHANTMNVDARSADHEHTVRIDALLPQNTSHPGEQGVDLDVTVPAQIAVQVIALQGAVHIDGINGSMNVEASDSIDAQNIRSSNGPIAFEAHGGGISVDQVQGQVSFLTSSGHIEVSDGQLTGESRMKTQDGKIVFDGDMDPDGTYHFMSQTGSISLSLPSTTSFNLHSSTEQGSFDNEFDSDHVGSPPQATLLIRTTTGNIEINENN